MTCLPMLPELGNKSLDRNLKKYLYKYKRLVFRKVAVLEPTILSKMIFTSKVIFKFLKNVLEQFFPRKHTYLVLYTKYIFDKSSKYTDCLTNTSLGIPS